MISLEVIRQLRIGPFTVFDTATAYIGIFLIAPILTWAFSKIHVYIKRTQWLWLTLPIGLTTHLALRLNTPFTKMFLSPKDYYFIPQLVILAMLFMGLKNINKRENIGK